MDPDGFCLDTLPDGTVRMGHQWKTVAEGSYLPLAARQREPDWGSVIKRAPDYDPPRGYREERCAICGQERRAEWPLTTPAT